MQLDEVTDDREAETEAAVCRVMLLSACETVRTCGTKSA
jgi:hypothetical protein